MLRWLEALFLEESWLNQLNNSLNSRLTGQFLITIGIISVLAFIFLIIFYVGYSKDISSLYIFGTLNDILGSLEVILSAVLATILIFSQSKRLIWLNLIGAILSWTGAFIVTLDSLMAGNIIPKNTGTILSIKYGFPSQLTYNDLHFGGGLIGIWLLIIIIQAAQTKSWPNHLIGLGLITGILMMIGLSGSPAALGFVFLYPIWCIWLGRWILKNEERITSHEE